MYKGFHAISCSVFDVEDGVSNERYQWYDACFTLLKKVHILDLEEILVNSALTQRNLCVSPPENVIGGKKVPTGVQKSTEGKCVSKNTKCWSPPPPKKALTSCFQHMPDEVTKEKKKMLIIRCSIREKNDNPKNLSTKHKGKRKK